MSSPSGTPRAVARSRRYLDIRPGEVWCVLHGDLPGVVMRGEIDLATEPQLDNAYGELVQLAPADVILDLAEVTFIGGVGLRLIVRLAARLSSTGHKLIIESPSRPAQRLLELTGFA
ncbi:STAS domain-containing protein [Nocardia sp. NPDC052001]|uniref:STAS domain-containing protein n=1 Tax=Nocardia sp. NPDC052001 TaxID=3154853 RepID=UPI00342BA90A